MDGLGVGSHGSLLESLSQGRVSVARSRNVLGGSAVLQSQGTLGNHLTGVGADDVDTKETIGLGVGNHLDHAVSVEVGLGSRVGAEGEGADSVGDLLVLEVLLGLADPGDLGESVHDGGDDTVVDMAVTLLDVLDNGDSLFLGLVGKHGTEGNITHTSDVGDLGSVLGVDDDTATLVELHANVLDTQATGVRSSADGDEHNIRFNLSIRSAFNPPRATFSLYLRSRACRP